MRDWIGDPEDDYEALMRRSPVFRAAEIEVPVMIVHGDADERVDIEHAARLVAMLEVLGKPMSCLVPEDETHLISNAAAVRTFSVVGDFIDDQIRGLRTDAAVVLSAD